MQVDGCYDDEDAAADEGAPGPRRWWTCDAPADEEAVQVVPLGEPVFCSRGCAHAYDYDGPTLD